MGEQESPWNLPAWKFLQLKHDTIEVFGDSLLAGRMRKAAEALLPAGKGIRLHINDSLPDHVGLGSGTQAALSTAAAVNKIYGLGKSVRELAVAVGRGGTSGIGVAAFENGGFILDGGHKFKDKGAFSPSAASHVPPGPVLFRRNFPDWPIVLVIPNSKGAHDAGRSGHFQKMLSNSPCRSSGNLPCNPHADASCTCGRRPGKFRQGN